MDDALDVLSVILMEVPVDAIRKWRERLEQLSWSIAPPDRETWGVLPQHQRAMEKLAGREP